MAEPEPESQGALDLPAVHVLGPDWAETDCPISVRELTTRLRAAGAAGGARPTWSAYIPPAKASDALPVDDLVDMDVVDEMDELDEEEAEELAMQVLSSLEDKAKAAVLEAPGTGKQRKHPITALSWCTLSAEEGRWTSELRAAAAAEGAPPPAAELATITTYTVLEADKCHGRIVTANIIADEGTVQESLGTNSDCEGRGSTNETTHWLINKCTKCCDRL